jgi:hypothetical protein
MDNAQKRSYSELRYRQNASDSATRMFSFTLSAHQSEAKYEIGFSTECSEI